MVDGAYSDQQYWVSPWFLPTSVLALVCSLSVLYFQRSVPATRTLFTSLYVRRKAYFDVIFAGQLFLQQIPYTAFGIHVPCPVFSPIFQGSLLGSVLWTMMIVFIVYHKSRFPLQDVFTTAPWLLTCGIAVLSAIVMPIADLSARDPANLCWLRGTSGWNIGRWFMFYFPFIVCTSVATIVLIRIQHARTRSPLKIIHGADEAGKHILACAIWAFAEGTLQFFLFAANNNPRRGIFISVAILTPAFGCIAPALWFWHDGAWRIIRRERTRIQEAQPTTEDADQAMLSARLITDEHHLCLSSLISEAVRTGLAVHTNDSSGREFIVSTPQSTQTLSAFVTLCSASVVRSLHRAYGVTPNRLRQAFSKPLQITLSHGALYCTYDNQFTLCSADQNYVTHFDTHAAEYAQYVHDNPHTLLEAVLGVYSLRIGVDTYHFALKRRTLPVTPLYSVSELRLPPYSFRPISSAYTLIREDNVSFRLPLRDWKQFQLQVAYDLRFLSRVNSAMHNLVACHVVPDDKPAPIGHEEGLVERKTQHGVEHEGSEADLFDHNQPEPLFRRELGGASGVAGRAGIYYLEIQQIFHCSYSHTDLTLEFLASRLLPGEAPTVSQWLEPQTHCTRMLETIKRASTPINKAQRQNTSLQYDEFITGDQCIGDIDAATRALDYSDFYTRLGASGLQTLLHMLQDMPSTQITELNLSCNQIGDSALRIWKEVDPRAALQALTSLTLSTNRITIRGCSVLADLLLRYSALAHLDVSGNAIGDCGMSDIITAVEKGTFSINGHDESLTLCLIIFGKLGKLRLQTLRARSCDLSPSSLVKIAQHVTDLVVNPGSECAYTCVDLANNHTDSDLAGIVGPALETLVYAVTRAQPEHKIELTAELDAKACADITSALTLAVNSARYISIPRASLSQAQLLTSYARYMHQRMGPMLSVISLCINTLQLASYAFTLNLDWANSFTSGFGLGVAHVSHLNIHEAFTVRFWLSVSLVLLYILTFIPNHHGQVLAQRLQSQLREHGGSTLPLTSLVILVWLLSTTLFLPVFRSIVSAVDCTYHSQGGWSMDEDPGRHCWEGSHVTLTLVVVIVSPLYIALALRMTQCDGLVTQSYSSESKPFSFRDIRSLPWRRFHVAHEHIFTTDPQRHRIMQQYYLAMKVTLSCVSIFLTSHHELALSFFLVGGVLGLALATRAPSYRNTKANALQFGMLVGACHVNLFALAVASVDAEHSRFALSLVIVIGFVPVVVVAYFLYQRYAVEAHNHTNINTGCELTDYELLSE